MRDAILLVLAVVGIYASFVVAAALQRRGRRVLATFSPIFVFLPIAFICLGQIQTITATDAEVMVGFAFALTLVTWLYQRGK
jgi:hypothetical protein